ncbi:MAG TPA: nucleoside 2-deoxyribosyltransferase [Candidatus Paceibacterota bacterium]
MKIYFSGKIRVGREHTEFCASIINELRKYGQVLTEHLGDPNLYAKSSSRSATDIYNEDMNWLRESDIVIAEVSHPSLGVGYEIGQAESLGKPVICFYKPEEGKKLSTMIAGNKYTKVYEYKNLEDIAKNLEKELQK